MNVADQISTVRQIVEKYYKDNAYYCNLIDMTEDEKSHIINIGTSILCTKWDVGYQGGGFVQAFVNNDLLGAIGCADGTSYKGFKFFAHLMYNVGAPSTLFN